MNSREWRTLRIQKLRANPLCERCLAEFGRAVPARCIHHVVPVESGRSEAECRSRCFDFGNLQSLCFQCHSDIHKAERSYTPSVIRERTEERLETWKDRLERRFKNQTNNGKLEID